MGKSDRREGAVPIMAIDNIVYIAQLQSIYFISDHMGHSPPANYFLLIHTQKRGCKKTSAAFLQPPNSN